MREEKNRADENAPLITLKPWVRRSAVAVGVAIAGTHVVWPTLAIDGVFLGALAFAGFVALFDVDSIEWQGIKARRREIARAKAALHDAPPPTIAAIPDPAPVPQKPSTDPSQAHIQAWSSTIHSKPTDLMPPTNRFGRLVWGAEQIRIELIILAGNSGRLERVAPWSDYEQNELIEYLRPANLLSPQLINAVVTVFNMRNLALHTQVVDPASDLAMDVLQNLRSIHRYYSRIREVDVIVFRDQSLTTLHEFRGVMVVQIDEAGKVQPPNVYPRNSEYVRGRFVTWSWDMRRATDHEAWYRDSSTGEVKLAWSSAATFAGREYPEQWGLQYRLPRPDLGVD
jgi:hypothetical protein